MAECLGVVVAFTLASCGSSDQPAGNDKLLSGTVNIGLSTDEPGFGLLKNLERSGFEYDLANWLGRHLGFKVRPVDVIASERETDLQSRTVDLVVSSYSITDKRKSPGTGAGVGVSFAGPYMRTQQGMLVRTGDDRIRSRQDLTGKTVCTAGGTTSDAQLRAMNVLPVDRPGEQQCIDELEAGKVDALSTDQLILYGFALNDPQVRVLPNVTFGSEERYGIGLPYGDKATCAILTEKINEFIVDGYWDNFFRTNLPGVPSAGHKPDPNHLDPC